VFVVVVKVGITHITVVIAVIADDISAEKHLRERSG
jgi:hypothetical protein